MNRAQKIAWFTLVMLALALGLSVAAFGIGYFIFRVSAHQAAAGFGFIGIMGFSGLAPLLFKKDKDQLQLDERDLLIKRRVMLGAYSIFWPLFVLAAMVPWFIKGPQGMITVNYLPWMVFGGMFVVTLVQAIATLEQYGWRGQREKP